MKINPSRSTDNSSGINKSQSPLLTNNRADESSHQQPSLLQKKLDAAQGSSSEGLDKETKPGLEHFLGYSLSGIKVHNNPDAHQAADLIHANAYTRGNHIFLGNDANYMSPIQRKSLLAHEVVHTIQQKSFPSSTLQAKSIIDSPQTVHEQEANSIANDFVQQHSEGHQSPGLAMRRHSRIGTVSSPVIQRNIKDSKKLTNGEMELDFTKTNAAAAGGAANETGWVKFHPSATATESNAIRLIQVVRMTDTTGIGTTKGDPWKFTDAKNQFRNQTLTTDDDKKNIAGGFHVDTLPGGAAQRTKKADAEVVPYYNAYAVGATGKRKGAAKADATLWDAPGHTQPIKYNFVTSAKGADPGTNIWYGSALWGFEIYLDKGVAKIKGEYSSFRDYEGETTDAALNKFNEYYKNPGTAGAPAK